MDRRAVRFGSQLWATIRSAGIVLLIFVLLLYVGFVHAAPPSSPPAAQCGPGTPALVACVVDLQSRVTAIENFFSIAGNGSAMSFDLTTFAGFWAFGAFFVVAIYLFAHVCGEIINFVRWLF